LVSIFSYGSPYNLVPDIFNQTEEKPHGQEFGFRFMGVFKRVEFSLNYFNHYEDDGLCQGNGGKAIMPSLLLPKWKGPS